MPDVFEDAQSQPHPDELCAFVGGDHYLKKWDALIEGSSKFAGFNWPAFLFGTIWFFYRKLYLWGIAVFVAGYFLPVTILLLSPATLPVGPDLATSIVEILIVRLPAGIFANVIYYKKAAIATRNARNRPEERREPYLQARGGTNEVLMWITLMIFLTLTFLGSVLEYSNGAA